MSPTPSLICAVLGAWCTVGLPNPRRPLSEQEKREREANADRICCPVLGTLYRHGLLHPTPDGRVTWQEIWAGLRIIGFDRSTCAFQALGIAAYKESDPDQTVRSRGGYHRYLNIFRMNPGEVVCHDQVQHGMSTTIRDSRFDPPAGGRGAVRESRREQFERWFGAPGVWTTGTDGEQRCTVAGLARLLGDVKTSGDFSGEWSVPTLEQKKPRAAEMGHRAELGEWQALFAWATFFVAFGSTEPEGGGGLHMTRSALEAMFLRSEFPDGWQEGRRLGVAEGAATIAALGSATGLVLPAQVEEEIVRPRSYGGVHSGMQMVALLSKRGMGGLDPDPPTAPDEPNGFDTCVTWLVRLALLCGLVYGWGLVLALGPLADSRNVAGGLLLATIPTLWLVSVGKSLCRDDGGGAGHGGLQTLEKKTSAPALPFANDFKEGLL